MSQPQSQITFRWLGEGDEALLQNPAPDVFDHPTKPPLVAEFLGDPRHHLLAAISGGVMVGFLLAVHYVHPDKSAQLWINELGVAPSHRRQGIGAELVQLARRKVAELGCTEAWVLTEPENEAAIRLYTSTGGERTESVMFTFPLF